MLSREQEMQLNITSNIPMAFSGRPSSSVDSTLLKWSYLQEKHVTNSEIKYLSAHREKNYTTRPSSVKKTYKDVSEAPLGFWRYLFASFISSEVHVWYLSSPISVPGMNLQNFRTRLLALSCYHNNWPLISWPGHNYRGRKHWATFFQGPWSRNFYQYPLTLTNT